MMQIVSESELCDLLNASVHMHAYPIAPSAMLRTLYRIHADAPYQIAVNSSSVTRLFISYSNANNFQLKLP